ncbi:MAG: ATP-binding protein [Pirellulaceae bacterium]|jgi:two-component system phosphate regulon sensor histidine kinase PhoR|nr:ATP-binding protein [Pirellulaceae bacterium]
MWFSRLSVKLFLVYAALNFGLAVAYVSLVAGWQKRLIEQQIELRLRDTALALRDQVLELVAAGRNDRLQRVAVDLSQAAGMRVTVVGPAGAVLADSDEDPAGMQNHRNRPEFEAAAQRGVGTAVRLSTTVRRRMSYLALRLDREGRTAAFVRVAVPLEAIDTQATALHRYLWISASVVGAIALALTYLIAGRIMRPLYRLTDAAEAVAAGDYQQRIPVGTEDEVGTLARAVDHMRRALTRQVAELRENSQLLETVLSSMLEGVLAVNADQRVLFANAASRSLLGIEARQVSGRPLLEVTRNRVVREAVEEAFRLDEPYEFEFEVSGLTRRYLAVRATRLPGEPCPGVVVVLHDITDLRRLENVRREFVANVSHELKTPLAGIKAYAETLRMGAIHDAEHNELFVARIEEQADRLHQLIQDLLHLARVESGREAFDIRDVSLAAVIEGCLPTYLERAQAKQLALQIESSEVDVVIRADEGALATILDNLVGNAIQYTPQGGRVVIRCRAEGDSAVCEVEDTGVGISPRDQTRIFERFYRVDKARSRELGGTGLGLAIVKHLTQAFGGQVSVRSELDKGSVFQIRLPLAK